MPKSMTLRLPDEKAAELEAIARADKMPVSEAVREAIDKLIAEKRKDENFRDRIRQTMAENQRVLERLAG